MKLEETQKLKPVIFVKGSYINYYGSNTLVQGMLLKAMLESNDPQEWRKKAGLKTIGDLERELDKMARHKKYCKILEEKGVTLPWVVDGLKDLALTSDPSTRLRTYQTILRSLGLDSFKNESEVKSLGWEDEMVRLMENSGQPLKVVDTIEKYEVNYPQIPEGEQELLEQEAAIGKDLYA